MSPQVVLAVVALIDRALASAAALRGVKDVIENAQREGREITLDDLKQYSLADDEAREALVQAINAAES